MPTKFKPSTKDRKGNMTHTFIHTVPTAELQEALDSSNTAPKRKQKIRNELVRRETKITQPTVKKFQRALFP